MAPRAANAGIVALMALGSLVLWIGVPLAWLWLTRHADEAAPRFLLVLAGCAVTMPLVGWLLYRLEAVRQRSRRGGARRRPSFMRSLSDDQTARRRLSLLDRLLMASALIALAALVLWWALLADNPNPSGPLQPL